MSRMTGIINIEDVYRHVWPYNLVSRILTEYGKAEWQGVSRVYIPDVLESVDGLPNLEKRVIIYRYKLGQTYEQIGKEFGTPNEKIRAYEKRALCRLRSMGTDAGRKIDGQDDIGLVKMENIILKDAVRKITEIINSVPDPSRGVKSHEESM